MPPARRRRRREPSSDAIEEDGADQDAGVEDVADADEADVVQAAPLPPSRRKAKKAAAAPAQQPEEEEEDAKDIIANFKDQPLDKFERDKLAGVANDWRIMREQVHSSFFGLMNDVGSSVSEFAQGDKGEKAILDIDNVMRQLLDTEVELKLHEDTLSDILQRVAREEAVANVTDEYQSGVDKKHSAYKTKTSRQKYAKSEEYRKFRQAIFEVQHPGDAMPPVTDLISRESGDVSDDDDDVEIGGVTQDYRCPLSLTILEDPLTSTLCDHSFSAKSIMEYLGQKQMVTCPASGCKQMLTRACLQPNKALAKQAREAARRERARNDSEEESDDDEVIE
ncbi:hypothetical protein EUX98_g3539 [Antrodiella citrinella]|uniref:SP-RING-type domain-containing protein n=1 Tax=Antrodiella citrinella TaxID=2447956 RepID=A0A4S4MWC2_9APHY|nr:hypothetical protein EUX98_g3539 [Antrodiella citrinella]